jgi:hypothetical protein
MTQRSKPTKAEHKAIISWLSGQFEGSERYRPSSHALRWGIKAELRVRVDDKREAWTKVTRWYKTEPERNEALAQLRAGDGLYGQQQRAGRLRRVAVVTR